MSAILSDPFQGRETRHEEVLAALEHVERLDAVKTTPHRFLRNRERPPVLLPPNDRVTLVAGADEIAVVDPLLLEEFDRGHGLGAHEEEDGAARLIIILFGQRVRIVWQSERRAAPDQAMEIDVGQTG